MTSLPDRSRRLDSRQPASITVYGESAGGGLALQSTHDIGLLKAYPLCSHPGGSDARERA